MRKIFILISFSIIICSCKVSSLSYYGSIEHKEVIYDTIIKGDLYLRWGNDVISTGTLPNERYMPSNYQLQRGDTIIYEVWQRKLEFVKVPCPENNCWLKLKF